MTEISFYHLTRKTLEHVLPELLEKTVARGARAIVMAGSPERAEALTQHLWSYNANHFLPHGNVNDGSPERQPIWLTATDERPNDAAFLFLTDGATSTRVNEYERVFDLFDGNDAEAVTSARARWSALKSGQHILNYWQQTDRGWTDATPQG